MRHFGRCVCSVLMRVWVALLGMLKRVVLWIGLSMRRQQGRMLVVNSSLSSDLSVLMWLPMLVSSMSRPSSAVFVLWRCVRVVLILVLNLPVRPVRTMMIMG